MVEVDDEDVYSLYIQVYLAEINLSLLPIHDYAVLYRMYLDQADLLYCYKR